MAAHAYSRVASVTHPRARPRGVQVGTPVPNGTAPAIAYEGIERIDVTPVNNITGQTGTDALGRLYTFKADPYEANDQLFNATFLGSGANINVDPIQSREESHSKALISRFQINAYIV